MAEVGSAKSILEHGLLSTSAALDRFKLAGTRRNNLESCHRPEKVTLSDKNLGQIVLRDQKPMSDQRLSIGLTDGLTPRQWYETINSKVFFWVREDRLHRLLNARAYRKHEHDVFTFDTESLVNAYEASIWLCHMNSGNTFPIPHRRGATTFRRIADYPAKTNGAPLKEVVELVVDYCLPDISKYVLEIHRMKGKTVIERMR